MSAEEAERRDAPVGDLLREKKMLSYAQINQEVFTDAALLNHKGGTIEQALEKAEKMAS